MYKLSLQRILIIIGICLVGVFFAIPNMLPNQKNLPKWWQPVSLGLDLQGGSSLLLQVKMDDVLKDTNVFDEIAKEATNLANEITKINDKTTYI